MVMLATLDKTESDWITHNASPLRTLTTIMTIHTKPGILMDAAGSPLNVLMERTKSTTLITLQDITITANGNPMAVT